MGGGARSRREAEELGREERRGVGLARASDTSAHISKSQKQNDRRSPKNYGLGVPSSFHHRVHTRGELVDMRLQLRLFDRAREFCVLGSTKIINARKGFEGVNHEKCSAGDADIWFVGAETGL